MTLSIVLVAFVMAADPTTSVEQITHGPKHHFFGYIGHVRTIPWNQDGRYLLSLRTDFQDRMPQPGEAADIVLLDAKNRYEERVLTQTRAWNFQQGSMMYWNPEAPATQFFFNDRDPKTHEVFCVLYDIAKNERIREYRYPQAVGNGGVAQQGGWFLAINYGRLARLRPVTGYPGAADFTTGHKGPPNDDGVFKVNVKTGERTLLASYKKIADVLRPSHPKVDEQHLFINHTLWSRDDRRVFFFARANFSDKDRQINVPLVMNADGSDLRPLRQHIGGHPEWESGDVMIGQRGKEQIRYDVVKQEVVGTLGSPEIFPSPGGDVALSPDGTWFVNGHGSMGKNYYTFLRLADGAWTRTAGFDQNGYTSGDLRIDPSPCWNRDGTAILVVAADARKTRQMFVVTLRR